MFENLFKKQSPESKDHQESLYEKLINSPMKKALILSMLLSSSPKAEQQNNVTKGGEKAKVENLESEIENEFNANDDNTKNETSLDLQNRFVVKDENGELKFSPWGIIAPLQFNVENDKNFEKKVNIKIPYFYSRQFNSAKEVDPNSKEKLAEFIAGQIKSQLADNFFSLDPSEISKEVYERDNGEINEQNRYKYSVDAIKVNGFASPEGPGYKGASTIDSNEVDSENIALGELRGNNIVPSLIEALKNQGISVDENLLKNIEIKGGEIQLSDEERGKIIEVAKKSNITGFTDDELIFNTFISFNSGQISNPDDVKLLNEIIASKRNVTVEITLKGGQKNVVSIPLPLLLLLPLFGLRQRKDDGDNLEQVEEKESLGDGGDDVKKEPLLLKESVVDPIYKQALEKIDDSMVKQTVLNDLMLHIDNEETVRTGIDYRAITKDVAGKIDAYGQKELEEEVTKMVLESWKQHDINARKKAGFNENDLLTGLDYENQPEQVAWAIVHARELITLAKSHDTNKFDADFNKAFLKRCQEVSSI